eukprot:9172443-Alexandrium_andersonii.AAC.1
MDADELQATLDELLADDLGENVRRVALARPLEELKVAGADSLLDLPLHDGQMAHAADSRAPADPNGSTA